MVTYKLKNPCVSPNSTTPLEDYLHLLGIKKTSSFLDVPESSDELSPSLLLNAETCVAKLHEGFTKGAKFFLQVDSDVDGYTSASIFYQFFKRYYPDANIVWHLHEGKEHGVLLRDVPQDAEYIIIPDAGSMQLEEQQALAEQDKIVLVMDHHTVTAAYQHPNVVVVNNQCSPLFPNKALSGAGVTFKIIQLYGARYPNMYVKAAYWYDLAALGILSDMMTMTTLDNNYIAYKGLNNINNELFKAILAKQAYSISDVAYPSKIDVVFYVTPLINAVIRMGTQDEKEQLFRALIEEPTTDYIDTVYRGVARHESFYQYVARIAGNIRERQNTQKLKCFEFLRGKIEQQGLDKHKVICVIASKDDEVQVPQNITGLIAMELMKYYNRPVLVLRPKMEGGELTYQGSGRGKQAEGFGSFLQFVRDSDYSEYGEGHAMAFGASIPASKYEDFITETDERLEDVEFSTDYLEVDAIFNQTNINEQMLYEFAKHNKLWCNGIPQPKIVLTSYYHGDAMFMGTDKTSIKIMVGNIACVKFKDKELAEQLTNTENAKLTIIGRPQLNEFRGYENIQLMIEYIDVEPINTKNLF